MPTDCSTLSAQEYRAALAAFDARPRDATAVKGWQVRLGFTGDDVDGIPGPKTRAALAYHAPRVTSTGAEGTDHAPVVLTRGDWNARPYRGRTRTLGAVRRITVHHTATAVLPASRAQTLDQTRAVQGMHRGQSWSDIGYHFLIGQDGTAVQGRAAHREHPSGDPLLADLALGSHVGGRNTGNVGVAVLGYFHAPRDHRMSPEATEALATLLRALCARYGLTGADVYGHREHAATACPGDALMPVVDQIRRSL